MEYCKLNFNTSSPNKPISEFDTGTLIQNVLNKRNQPQIQNLIKKQEQSENLLEKSIFRLPDGNVKVTGTERINYDLIMVKHINQMLIKHQKH